MEWWAPLYSSEMLLNALSSCLHWRHLLNHMFWPSRQCSGDAVFVPLNVVKTVCYMCIGM